MCSDSTEKINIKQGEYSSSGGIFRKMNPNIENSALEMLSGVFPTELRASEAQFEELYATALALYESGKYKEALPHFKLLMAGSGGHGKYLFSVAACHHMMKEYQQALGFYLAAAFSDSSNPTYLYYASDCFLRTHQPLYAWVVLDVGIKRGEDPQYQVLVERMKSMKDKLQKELGEKKTEEAKSFLSPEMKNSLQL